MKARAVIFYLLRVFGSFVGGVVLLLLFVLLCFIIFGWLCCKNSQSVIITPLRSLKLRRVVYPCIVTPRPSNGGSTRRTSSF